MIENNKTGMLFISKFKKKLVQGVPKEGLFVV